MNSAQLDHALRNDPCTAGIWRGVYPIDHIKTLPDSSDLPAAYIVNTAPSTHSGEHWVAFYFPSTGKSELFDSYGYGPKSPEMTTFLKSYGHGGWIKNARRLQGSLTTVCGQYCVFLLTLRARGKTLSEIEEYFEDPEWNDGLVKRFVNKHFKLDTKILNYKFLLQSVEKSA